MRAFTSSFHLRGFARCFFAGAGLGVAAGCNALFGLDELGFAEATASGTGGEATSSSSGGGTGGTPSSTGGAGGGSGGSGGAGGAGGAVPIVTAVSAGAAHTCALRSNGTLKCWGSNATGELGIGAPDALPHNKPVDVTAFGLLAEVSAGGKAAWSLGHTCARTLAENSVRCWGDDSGEQLGTGNGSPDVPGALALATGADFSCAVADGAMIGEVKCWGLNDLGQLGNGSQDSSSTPSNVSGLTDVSSVSCGGAFSCAVSAGKVFCWGSNLSGQLGTGETSGLSTVPVEVVGLTDVKAVAVGVVHACALTTGGQVQCWGNNDVGQLGDGTSVTRAWPEPVSLPPKIAMLTVGGRHACAVTGLGEVYCWGDNSGGQVGVAPLGGFHSQPKALSGSVPTIGIDGGDAHTCAILEGAQLRCWGQNSKGQLGDGTITDSATPVEPLL